MLNLNPVFTHTTLEEKMYKKFLITAILSCLITGLSSNAFALTWFWGTDQNTIYTNTAPSGTYWLPVPFTVVSNGDELVGASLPAPYLNGAYSPAVRTDSNMGSFWGVYNGTTVIPTGLAIALMPGSGYDVLPDGIYTSDNSLQLNFWSVDDPNHNRLFSATSLNSYRITIGDEPVSNAVPEPATLLLLGTGLIGSAFLKKRRV